MTDSYLFTMASLLPTASLSLGQVGPPRSRRDTSASTVRSDVAHLHDAEPMEFILSSNWVLRAGGVKDFYEALYRRDEVIPLDSSKSRS